MYQNHVLIDEAYKNRNLRGHVLCNVIYLYSDTNRWLAEQKQRFTKTLNEVTALLETEASKEGVALRFTVIADELLCNARSSERPRGLDEVLAKKNGFGTAEEYAEHLKKMYKADDIQLIFLRNEPIWEYATPNPKLGAFFVSNSSRPTAVLHEMLHLYGIKDLYLPAVKDMADYCFGDSVMSTGLDLGPQSIDPLTRFLIGWRKELGPVASWFLEQTRDVNGEEFENARKIKSNNLDVVFQTSRSFASIEEIQKAADAKDPWASFLIGHCYERGVYLQQDFQSAEKYYRQSFIGSCAPAGYALAEMLLSKKVISQNDKATAHRILLTLLDNPHHMFAVSLYAVSLYSGFSFQKRSLEDALSVVITNYNHYNYANFDEKTYFRKLPEVIQQHKLLEKLSQELPELYTSVKRIAEQYAYVEREGDAVMFFLFGHFLSDGTHPRPNSRRALELFLKAAQLGLSAAAYAVSYCYENGIGTLVDPVAAQLWAQKGNGYRKVEDTNPETRVAVQILNRYLDNSKSHC